MMLQEYGEDAPAPNKNTVYLAYLDSVKHFRPEEKDSGGTALRTMVYHEVLLAYIERAAMLGMNSIYIWSCPPLAVRTFSFCARSKCCVDAVGFYQSVWLGNSMELARS